MGRASLFVEEVKEERTSPNVTTYNAIITASEKGGEVQGALRAFAELRQWQKPDVISYSANISSCVAGGDWRRASLSLEEMKEERIWSY